MADGKENQYLTDPEIQSLKVPALKNYLRKHGQYVTGNKPALIDRAKGVGKLPLCNVNVVMNDDAAKQEVRHTEKLLTPLGEKIQEPSSLKNWTADVSEIPNFTDSETYNYLVLTMKATRQYRSRVYFEDRHLHSVAYNAVTEDCSHGIVRCKVIPSIPTANKKENPDHDVWICLSKVSGKIHSANCNCTAGNGEACNHISALLYALEDITKKKKDGTLSSTSQKCRWNNPRKRKLSPKKVQDLKFTKYHSSQAQDCVTDVRPDQSIYKQTINIDRVKQTLMGGSESAYAGWLTFFNKDQGEPEHSENEIPRLHDVLYMYHDSVDLESEGCKKDFQDRFNSLNMNEESATKIETMTNGQNKNDLWHEARRERITSSQFGYVCKGKVDSKQETTVRNIFGYNTFQSKYCDWGLKHEPAARRIYASHYVKDKGLHVQTCGLLVNPNYPHLGASPDGLVDHEPGCECNDHGILEIKCPASEKWKFQHPLECGKDSGFFCDIDPSNGSLRLKKTHVYYYQVQGQLFVSKRKWCDFMVWTLKGWTVERIQYDKEFCSNMLVKLNRFYIHKMLPEIFSLRVKRGIALYK